MWHPGHVILDEYEVLEHLGTGATASVYLVRQTGLGSRFAVKAPHPYMVRSAEDRLAFAREVRLWIGLPEHPHIVQCYFVREVDGLPVVFAEYVPSGVLGDWRQRGRLHGVPHVLDLAIQLAEAMTVAHAAGVIHRDLKPANCLMDQSGLLKVGDFGLAAARAELRRRRASTGAGASLMLAGGTPSYCSPEQFDRQPLDERTDIWSFGVTVFEVLTGRRPYLGPAAAALVRDCRAAPEAASLPDGLWDLLLELLQFDRSERPSSFVQVSSRLRDLYRLVTSHEYPRCFPAAPVPSAPTAAAGAQASPGVGTAALQHAIDRSAPGRSVEGIPVSSTTATHRPQDGKAVAEVAMLNEAARLHRQRLAERRSPEAVMELFGVLHLLAQQHRRLGNLQAAIDAYDEAVTELQQALRHSADRRIPLMLAEAIANRAVCQRQSGHAELAIRGYDHGIALLRSVEAARSESALVNELAGLHQNRAMALLKAHRFANAREDIDTCLAMRQQLVEGDAGHRYAPDLAGAYLDRGVLLRNTGDTAGAIRDYTCAIELLSVPDALRPVNAGEEALAQVHMNRGVAYFASGDLANAMQDCDRAVALFERLVRQHGRDDQLPSLAQAYNNRANARRLLKDLAGALADIDRCIQLREDMVERRGVSGLAPELGRAYGNKLLFLLASGRADSALLAADRAISLLGSAVETGHAETATDLAKIRMLSGVARCRMGAQEHGLRDIARSIVEYEELIDTGRADVFEGLIEALLAYLHAKPRGRTAAIPSVVSALASLHRAVMGGSRLPAVAVSKLAALGAMLPSAGGPGAGGSAAEARAMIQEMIERSEP